MNAAASSGEKSIPWPDGDWFLDFGSPVDLIAYKRQKVLVQGRSRYQEYEIFQSNLWGQMLILDGRLQSAQLDEYIYHEALVHPALVAHPEPRRVMVMGGGEGATLREALRHNTVTQAVMVDLDEEIVNFCRQWLPTFHAGAFEDPRTELVFADGRAWLETQEDGAFDVIIIDLPEPLEEGPARLLFNREMYRLVSRKLAPRGLMAVQSGSAGMLGRLMPDIFCTLKEVFARVMPYTAYVPSFMDLYGFHVAGGEGFHWPEPSQVAARLEARGATGLGWFGPEYAAAVPLLPVYLKERLAQQGRVLTEVEPFGPRPGERLFF